jgi:hypothetical protein
VLVPLVVAALAAAANPIPAENALPGTTAWQFDDVRGPVIQGYTSEISVLPGQTVHFHVQTAPADYYRIVVYRLGWYGGAGARLVACLPASCSASSSGQTFPEPSDGWLGARWPVTDELTVPSDWVSGYYLARFELRSGDQQGRSASALFVVRAPPERRSTILVQVPVNTWEAYNPWGGKALYDSLSEGGTASNRVSFDRPLPLNAFQTWEWEIQLVRFLEREGYDVSYQTDVDTHRDPGSLLTHRLVIVDGHDEYWTSRIRDAFDAARDAGTNLAFMGANIGYWQIRYEDAERTVVAYKESPDPVTDPTLQTVQFRQLTPPRPECGLLGVQYDESRRMSGDPPRDFPIAPAAVGDAWFEGTGFDAATTLPELMGPEWDFLPASPPEPCRKPGLVVFFHYGGLPRPADTVRYVAPSGARVFSAGSLRFGWGLDTWLPPSRGGPYPAIPGLQRFARNALADLTRPAPLLRFTGAPSGTGVALQIDRGPDPRLTATIVSRGDAVLCEGRIKTCVEPGLPGHRTYRYSAVNVDEWGRSVPAVVDVPVPNRRPTVTLRGPSRVRARRPAVFTAAAADRDGDRLAYRWSVDGKASPGGARRLVVRFQRARRHTVTVRVADGQGGAAAAALRVRAR